MSKIKLQGNASGTGTTTFQSANTSSNTTFTLPGTDGTNGQVLTTDGSGALTFTTVSGGGGTTTNALTMNSGGSGDASGTTFNGSAARTIDYSTVGAPKADGTGASGTWSISISGTATNATNVATTATSTNADFYIPFVAASTTGNQALGVDAGITYNPSTNAITAGISGGTF